MDFCLNVKARTWPSTSCIFHIRSTRPILHPPSAGFPSRIFCLSRNMAERCLGTLARVLPLWDANVVHISNLACCFAQDQDVDCGAPELACFVQNCESPRLLKPYALSLSAETGQRRRLWCAVCKTSCLSREVITKTPALS